MGMTPRPLSSSRLTRQLFLRWKVMLARAGVVWVQAAIQSGDAIPMPFGGQGTGFDFSPSDNVVDPASPMMIDIPLIPWRVTLPVTSHSRASRVQRTSWLSTPPITTRCSTICNSAAPAEEHRPLHQHRRLLLTAAHRPLLLL